MDHGPVSQGSLKEKIGYVNVVELTTTTLRDYWSKIKQESVAFVRLCRQVNKGYLTNVIVAFYIHLE